MSIKFENDTKSLAQIGRSAELFIQQDPGNRGLAKWAIDGTLFPAAVSLAGANHCILTTGFYILSAGVIETDGPLGSIVLAKALEDCGKKVTILTDEHAMEIMREGMKVVGCKSELVAVDIKNPQPHTDFIKDDTTHMIALERPGRAANGLHHNFRSKIISDFTAPIDDIYETCLKSGIITIGIGDGGNELGMGNVSKAVDEHIAPDRAYSCKIPSDYCVCAGVSNWAGYALAALLSRIVGKQLVPEMKIFDALMAKIVEKGAVDGVSGKCEQTVDGMSRDWEDTIYSQMLEISKNR